MPNPYYFRSLHTIVAVLLWAFLYTRPVSASAPHYELTLSIDVQDTSIVGIERITTHSANDSLFTNLYVEGLSVDSVHFASRKIGFEVKEGRLLLDQQAHKSIRIWYHGKPQKGLHIGASEMYTGFHTQYWMICDPRPSTKATFDLAVAIPSNVRIIGNGDLISETHNEGITTAYYRQTIPVSAYLFGFAAGLFKESTLKAGHVNLKLFSNTFSEIQRDSILAITANTLRYFERTFAMPYPYDSYTQVFTDDENEQEASTFALLSNDYLKEVLDESREDWLIIHELAHQWFGNSITCATWSDFWLNEGMVTFLTAVRKESESGRDEYDRDMFLSRARYARLMGGAQDRPIVWNKWRKAEDMSGTITYYKAALVLNYLRYQIGDDALWRGIKSYAQQHWQKTVTTAVLKSAVEKASHKDLKQFFDQWVFSASCPHISMAYHVFGDSLVMIFTQDSATYTVPFPIAIEDSSGRSRYQFILTQHTQTLCLPIHGVIRSIRADDGGVLPMSIATNLPDSMLIYQTQNEPDIIGRIEALTNLTKRTTTMDAEERATYRYILDKALSDSSRMVNAVARKYLSALDVQNGKK